MDVITSNYFEECSREYEDQGKANSGNEMKAEFPSQDSYLTKPAYSAEEAMDGPEGNLDLRPGSNDSNLVERKTAAPQGRDDGGKDNPQETRSNAEDINELPIQGGDQAQGDCNIQLPSTLGDSQQGHKKIKPTKKSSLVADNGSECEEQGKSNSGNEMKAEFPSQDSDLTKPAPPAEVVFDGLEGNLDIKPKSNVNVLQKRKATTTLAKDDGAKDKLQKTKISAEDIHDLPKEDDYHSPGGYSIQLPSPLGYCQHNQKKMKPKKRSSLIADNGRDDLPPPEGTSEETPKGTDSRAQTMQQVTPGATTNVTDVSILPSGDPSLQDKEMSLPKSLSPQNYMYTGQFAVLYDGANYSSLEEEEIPKPKIFPPRNDGVIDRPPVEEEEDLSLPMSLSSHKDMYAGQSAACNDGANNSSLEEEEEISKPQILLSLNDGVINHPPGEEGEETLSLPKSLSSNDDEFVQMKIHELEEVVSLQALKICDLEAKNVSMQNDIYEMKEQNSEMKRKFDQFEMEISELKVDIRRGKNYRKFGF